jgi:putative FmdB family regulatory protein
MENKAILIIKEERLMPTYEYKCEKCGHKFEQFQSITAAQLKQCPVCQGPVKRLLSGGGGVIFKGSGFHTTDYKAHNPQGNVTHCGKEQTCCGRETPCAHPHCED